ncbi:UvrD-helicase domain-containing protein [Rhodococcus sp. NPDC060176]|uniref:UvrD-helicase domain-containing protein n=1 Tax=Rhodococcus sp. NPDC060176 TaxID=3347062 RepID=UPI00364EB5D7
MTFAPTDEQLHIHSLFRTGNPLLVRAGAGTGKTTTLLQLADILGEQGRSGLYLAFNKSIATEAGRKFPRHMMSSTAHALAFRGLRGTAHAPLLDKLEMGKVPFSVTERELGILPMTARGADGRQRVISAYQITRQVLRTVEEFCKTTDQDIGPQHVPPMIGLDSRGEHHNQRALVEHVLPLAVKAWRDVYSTSGTAVKFSHGHYLKLWAMIRPRFGPEGAALFLDEAQDTSPVLAGVLAEQTHLQQVFVGDSSQSIYRFTGARNAMREFGNVSEGRLTQSWRFGPAIADAANQLLADLGDDMRLKGNPSLLSRVTTREPTVDAVLTRTNGVALERVMAAQAAGVRVHLMGDQKYALRFCEGAENLQNGDPAGHEDLAAFTTWGQVQDHAQDSPDSADWKTLVALIDDHGVPAVKTALAHSVPEASAQLVVATAHRSKGREWDRVELASDLDEALQEATEAAEEGGAADNAVLRDEQMLCYVAVTRAKTALAPGGVIAPELYTAATSPVVGMTSVFDEAAARERTAGESVSVTVEFSAAELSQISGTAGGDLALWLHRLALAAAEHGRIAS